MVREKKEKEREWMEKEGNEWERDRKGKRNGGN